MWCPGSGVVLDCIVPDPCLLTYVNATGTIITCGGLISAHKSITIPLHKQLFSREDVHFRSIGVAPITQLRTCLIKIVTLQGGHLMW